MSSKLNVLSISERFIPSNILGVIKPMLKLQHDGIINFRMKFSFMYKETDIIWADTVVLCRSMTPDFLHIIELVKKHRKRLIYDIDDNFFELSVASDLGRYHRNPVHLYAVTQCIKHADAVRVYSKPMEEIVQQINPNVFRLKSYFDFSLIEGLHPRKHDKIRIVYATSRGNSDSLAQICLPAVASILAKYPGEVEFYTFGKIPGLLKGVKGVHRLSYIRDYSKFIRKFMSMGFDIGLAPLHDDRFCNSKTNNKFREYGAMGVCGIYSNAEIYRECIQDHNNGLIVNNSVEEWYHALCELIETPELREKIKANARQSVKQNYSMDSFITDWQKIFDVKAKESLPFNDILNLRIAVLRDEKSRLPNYRLVQLITLLGMCDIRYKLYDFNKVDLIKLKKYDVIICCVSKVDDVKTWITTLKNFSLDNIIIDTLLPCQDISEYADITFTNSKVLYDNTFFIKDIYSCSDIDLGAVVLSRMSVAQDTQSFADLFEIGINNIKNNEENVYSAQSPVFMWADLLSRYAAKHTKEKIMGIMPYKIGILSRLLGYMIKLNNLLRIIWQHTGQHMINCLARFYNRINWLLGCAEDYIKVNFWKKY